MRTNYQKPNTKIVLLKHQALMLGESQGVGAVNTNLDPSEKINYYNTGSAQNSRSRSFDDWDDED